MSIYPARFQLTARPDPEGGLRAGALNRRELMKLASFAALGTAAASTGGASLAGPAEAATVRWPGHKPGYIYLGASSAEDISKTISRTGQLGLQRTFYKWGDGTREDRNIRAHQAAGRLPWISFKPPSTAPGGWAAISSGRYDADIRARARRYAGLSRPVIVTFNHEPHNDSTGTPAEWAAAWTRIHDVMKSETALKNVVSVPIIGEWVFNPVNRRGEPRAYLSQAVLSRCHFLGLDLYQMKSGDGYDVRLGRITAWLDSQGHPTKMVGLGETGAANGYGTPSGAAWWTKSWKWAAANTDRVAAISYFNSLHNNNAGMNWMLWESSAKLDAFRASLASTTSCTL